MARRQVLTMLSQGLLVISAVAPAVVAAWDQTDLESSAVLQTSASEPDTLFVNGRAFILE